MGPPGISQFSDMWLALRASHENPFGFSSVSSSCELENRRFFSFFNTKCRRCEKSKIFLHLPGFQTTHIIHWVGKLDTKCHDLSFSFSKEKETVLNPDRQHFRAAFMDVRLPQAGRLPSYPKAPLC